MSRVYSADQFVLLDPLGQGSFGIVYKALDKITNQLVAIKQIDLENSDEDINEIQKEITILSTCKFPQIIKYYGCYVNSYKLSIIMEILNGGSCLDFLVSVNSFKEAHIAIICREILRALHYLHQNNKIHRDIKAANILIDDNTGDVKMVDFGVATQLSNNLSKRNTFVGTPFWMSPEVILQHDYNYKTDIWSLGITAIELALGKPPLSNIHPLKVLFLIPKNQSPTLPSKSPFTKEPYSNDFHSFVKCCLMKSSSQRPTAKQLLNHPFIKKAGKNIELLDVVHLKRKLDAQKIPKTLPKPIKSNSFHESVSTQITFDLDDLRIEENTPTGSVTSNSPPLSIISKRNISPSSITSGEITPSTREKSLHLGSPSLDLLPASPKKHSTKSRHRMTKSQSNYAIPKSAGGSESSIPRSKSQIIEDPFKVSGNSKISLFDFEIKEDYPNNSTFNGFNQPDPCQAQFMEYAGNCLTNLEDHIEDSEQLEKFKNLNRELARFKLQDFPMLVSYFKDLLTQISQGAENPGAPSKLYNEIIPEELTQKKVEESRPGDEIEELLLSRWAEGVLERWD